MVRKVLGNKTKKKKDSPLKSKKPKKDPRAEASPNGVLPEKRHEMIAKAAYYRAERRGFAPGAELEDWLAAEAEIRYLLGEEEAGQR
jgi:hypothetical protein